MILQEVCLLCRSQTSRPILKRNLFYSMLNASAGGLGSLLEIRCSRAPIIVDIIGEDDSSNEIHLKRLQSVIAICSRNTV